MRSVLIKGDVLLSGVHVLIEGFHSVAVCSESCPHIAHVHYSGF